MGYYTTFELANDAGFSNDTIIDRAKAHDESLGEELQYGLQNGETKWYSFDDDMRKVSKLFPNVLFTLNGEGEESGDIWKAYFKNGDQKVLRSEITFPEFDTNSFGEVPVSKRPVRPEVKNDIDVNAIKEAIDNYLFDFEDLNVCEDDQSTYEREIYTVAVEAIYGEEIWDYINYWITENEG